MRDEATGSAAMRRRSRARHLNSPWWIPSINETSRRCRVEPEVRRVAASSLRGRNGKNIFQNMRGLKGWGRRLERSGKEDRREIKSCFFFSICGERRAPAAAFSTAASAAGANRGRRRVLWNSQGLTVQRWTGHPAAFGGRARVPHLSLLRHPYSRWLRRLLPQSPQNPGLTSPSSLQLPVLDLPLQCALMTFTSPLWAGATRIPHKSALRRTSNETAMITRRVVSLSDSPVNCPSCLFCVLFCCLAVINFYVGLGFKYSPEKCLFNKYALAALLLVFPVLRCTRSCLRKKKKKSGWAGGQRPVMHSNKLLLVSVWVTPKHYETLRFFFIIATGSTFPALFN